MGACFVMFCAATPTGAGKLQSTQLIILSVVKSSPSLPRLALMGLLCEGMTRTLCSETCHRS